MRTRPVFVVVLMLTLVSLSACDKSGASAVVFEFEKDGSGALTVTALSVPKGPAAVESGVSGAEMDRRVQIVSARGQVGARAEPEVYGIKLQRRESGLRIRVPRRAGRQWDAALAPKDAADRKTVTTVVGAEPTGQVKIELKIPHKLTSHGFHPGVPDVAETVSFDKKTGVTTCALLIPVDMEIADTDLLWVVTWRED